MGKYCIYCGAELPPNASFCVECGNPVADDSVDSGNTVDNVNTYWSDDPPISVLNAQEVMPPQSAEEPTRVMQQPAVPVSPAANQGYATGGGGAGGYASQGAFGSQAGYPGAGGLEGTSVYDDQVPTPTQAVAKKGSALPYVLTGLATALIVVVAGVFVLRGSLFGPGAQDQPSEESSSTTSEEEEAEASEGKTSKKKKKTSKTGESSGGSSKSKEKQAEPDPESESAFDIVEVSIVGANGETRVESIRRQGTTQRVFPDSNDRALTDEEIRSLSDAERCIAWNEIIAASSGYQFKNSGLRSYFNACSWYRPVAGGSGGAPSGVAGQNVQRLQSATSDWWKNLATY